MSTRDKIIRHMQRVGEAGRRELSEITGTSHVMVGRVVAQLCHEGILSHAGTNSSEGGRPAQRYRYNPQHASVLFFRIERDAGILQSALEKLDMQGNLQEETRGRFTHIQPEMLDERLDTYFRHQHLSPGRIALHLPPEQASAELADHLRHRYGRQVIRLNAAAALADTRPHTLTLLCSRAHPLSAAHRQSSSLHPCPHIESLPLPAWEQLDYSDHTLVEETLSRLLQMLTCILSTERVVLHSDSWSERLLSRIRYNLSTKLKNHPSPPRLHFRTLHAEQLTVALRRAAAAGTIRS